MTFVPSSTIAVNFSLVDFLCSIFVYRSIFLQNFVGLLFQLYFHDTIKGSIVSLQLKIQLFHYRRLLFATKLF